MNPLLKVLREAERDAERYGAALGIVAKPKGKAGRPPTGVVTPLANRRITRKSELRGVENAESGPH